MNEGSVSIIRLWDVLLLPLQGEVTDLQAERLSDEVLRQVEVSGPRGLVIDLSGVALLDSHLCSSVAHLTSAARLMGTRAFITGISPHIAMTLETMGLTFKDVTPVATVEQAFESLGVGAASHNVDGRPAGAGLNEGAAA